MRKVLTLIYVAIVAGVFFVLPLHAYIDPAVTTYIIQVVAGVFITAGAVFGIFRKKIRMFFKNMKLKRLEKRLTAQANRRESGGSWAEDENRH